MYVSLGIKNTSNIKDIYIYINFIDVIPMKFIVISIYVSFIIKLILGSTSIVVVLN